MDNHPIENLMKSTMENIKQMVDVNTIVGEPVQAYDGALIIPISKVSFGFASGGSEFSAPKATENSKNPFGGGSGAGVSIKPVGFLVVKDESVRLLSVDQHNTYDKIVDTVPQVLDMFKGMMKPNNDKKDDNSKNKHCKDHDCKDDMCNEED